MSTNTNRVNNPMKVITGPDTRWSYANVWEPKSINGGTPKYSVSLIIPKSDTKTVAKIKAAIEAAYYYARSVYQDLDIPYLTNFMRWRDGAEETSALAVFVRDPGSDEVGMFTDAGIVSDEPFPEKRTRKHVKKRG